MFFITIIITIIIIMTIDHYSFFNYTAHGTALQIISVSSEHTARSWLRSAQHTAIWIQVPRLKTQLWWYTTVAGPASRNRLPATIRSSDSAEFQEPNKNSLFLTDRFLSFPFISDAGDLDWLDWTLCYGAYEINALVVVLLLIITHREMAPAV